MAPAFTAVITFEPHGQGTKYTATVMHQDEAGATHVVRADGTVIDTIAAGGVYGGSDRDP